MRVPMVPQRRASKNRLGARGRAAVLWFVIAFIGLQLLYYPLSKRWPQLHDGEFGYKLYNLRAQLAARTPGQPAVVMFGSSLTGWGLNPESMTTLQPGRPGRPVVFNFGINSSGPVVQLLCLRRLLADGIRPDLVLLEIHPWFLYHHYNHVADPHYLPENRTVRDDRPVLRSYDPKWEDGLPWERRQKRCLPWYYGRYNLQNVYATNWLPPDKRSAIWTLTDRHGWEGRAAEVGSGPLPPEVQLKSARHHLVAMSSVQIDPTFPRAYREVLTTCQRHGIAVQMVRMPETTCMRQEMPAELRKRIDDTFQSISADTGVPIVDARDWVADHLFTDAFHMIRPGSETFSRRLEQECLLPFLAKSGQ